MLPFSDYYYQIISFNCLLGVEFVFRHPSGENSRPRRIVSLVSVAAFILTIWTGIILSALFHVVTHDIVSKICNWMQLLSVCMMSTGVAVWLSMRKSFYSDDVLKCISDIDGQFRSADLPLNYQNQIRYYRKWSRVFILYLILFISFDYYVWIFRDVHKMSFAYWLLLFAPMVFNSLVVFQMILIMSLVSERFTIIRKRVKNIQFEGISITKLYQNLLSESIESQLQDEANKMTLFTNILHILNDLVSLCRKLNYYFSLVLTTALFSFFVMTLIQIYYAFLMLFNMSDTDNRTVLEITTCVDLALLPLTLIIVLCSVCQRISAEAAKIMRIFNSYQATHDLVG